MSRKFDLTEATVQALTEGVNWEYFDKFNDIIDKYMPDQGEGDTLASQIVTAINKLIYKWYNDGDVFDNVNSGMDGWANDLSSYANWLNKYCKPASRILDSIYGCNTDDEYANILRALADKCLNSEYLATVETPAQGSIYECDGPFEFDIDKGYEDEDEEDEDIYYCDRCSAEIDEYTYSANDGLCDDCYEDAQMEGEEE